MKNNSYVDIFEVVDLLEKTLLNTHNKSNTVTTHNIIDLLIQYITQLYENLSKQIKITTIPRSLFIKNNVVINQRTLMSTTETNVLNIINIFNYLINYIKKRKTPNNSTPRHIHNVVAAKQEARRVATPETTQSAYNTLAANTVPIITKELELLRTLSIFINKYVLICTNDIDNRHDYDPTKTKNEKNTKRTSIGTLIKRRFTQFNKLIQSIDFYNQMNLKINYEDYLIKINTESTLTHTLNTHKNSNKYDKHITKKIEESLDGHINNICFTLSYLDKFLFLIAKNIYIKNTVPIDSIIISCRLFKIVIEALNKYEEKDSFGSYMKPTRILPGTNRRLHTTMLTKKQYN